tara:strand:+ start:2270 stop:2788 length:519 start_codon:yes stop_codon:yes gene_type:complete
MKKKITFFLVTLVCLFFFFIFFKSIYKKNYYTPEKYTKNLVNFQARNLFTNEHFKSNQLFLDEKFTVINIWASWCIPCLQEHKYLMSLKNNIDIYLVGLNYKDKEKNAKKFILENGNPYDIILIDNNGIISIELGAFGVPETFIIQNKKIIKKYIGPLNKKNIAEIKKIAEK